MPSVRKKRPTIVEVARRAGVSVGTASNVINDRGPISEAARAKVERAIAELGYRPNMLARSLTQRRFPPARAGRKGPLPRLTTAGYLSVDYTARVDVLPHRDDRITATSIEKSLGGPAANVAVMAAAMDGHWPIGCDLITVLGDDADSDWAIAELAHRGVEVVGLGRRPGQRLSRCIVLVEPNGSRTIINEPFSLGEPDLSPYLDPTDADRPHCLHLDGFQVPTLFDSLGAVRARGVATSMHATGLPEAWRTPERFERLCRSFDLIFLNREAAQSFVGFRGPDEGLAERVRLLRQSVDADWGPEIIVLTLGASGALILPRSCEPARVQALEVEPVDTTGAGDSFVGIFLAGWLSGASAEEAGRFAAIGASLTVTAFSAQGLIPSAGMIADRLGPNRDVADETLVLPRASTWVQT